MKRFILLLLLISIPCFGIAYVIYDDFNDGSIAAFWANSNPAGTVVEQYGSLIMKGDLSTSTTRMVSINRSWSGKYSAKIKLNQNAGGVLGQTGGANSGVSTAGIKIYETIGGNYYSIYYQVMTVWWTRYLSVAATKNGISIGGIDPVPVSSALYLKIENSGSTNNFMYSTNEATWTTFTTEATYKRFAQMQVYSTMTKVADVNLYPASFDAVSVQTIGSKGAKYL